MSSSKYVQAATTVLEEVGGGPIRSKELVAKIVEKGLLEDRPHLYHNILHRVREDEAFDTSKRGYVSLAPQVSTQLTAPIASKEDITLPEEPKVMVVGGEAD